MSRLLSALLAAVVISFTGFSDHNGNWSLDQGERMAGGQYEIYVTAADGAVRMFMVSLPMGHWYRLEVDPGDRVEIVSGCGRITIVAGDVLYVPVICRAIHLPMIGGAR